MLIKSDSYNIDNTDTQMFDQLRQVLNDVDKDDDSEVIGLIQSNLDESTETNAEHGIKRIEVAIAIAKSTARNRKNRQKREEINYEKD